MIRVINKYAFADSEYEKYTEEVRKQHKALYDKTCPGGEFTGWTTWYKDYDKEEYERIKDAARRIRKDGDVLVVCGIGGSYLGARSAVEALTDVYSDAKPEIIFAGNTLSSNYLTNILRHVKGKSVYLNIISKSGSTTETAVSSRIFEQYMVETYGQEEASKRIFCTTDKSKGPLKEMSDLKGYETFVVPDHVGGRYSVMTAVGLLPIAAAGVDIDMMMAGSRDASIEFNNENLMLNEAYKYAVARRILNAKGYDVEMFVTYEPQLIQFGEWWKQLAGESEGKDNKGIFPASAVFTTDLHSMGQYIQDGKKILFETVLNIIQPQQDIIFPYDERNLDKMNYLTGKSVDWANHMAMQGTLQAHAQQAGVPNIIVELMEFNAYGFGYMAQFFFHAISMSCLLLGVNPFDQPGVEVYKKNMFKLLGKE